MVSMKDIARKCGVSTATVSKALNDHEDIGEETKKLIKKTAREMGYFPNSSARALKTKKTDNIGVLFVDATMNGLTHGYFSQILNSFKVAAEERGYDLTFINGIKKSRQMTYLEHCRYRGFDGVMIACVEFSDPEVVELVNSPLPVVTIDHSFDSKPSVVSNNVLGMEDLLKYIASQGHKKVAYIDGGDRSTVTMNRIGTYWKMVDELGLEHREDYLTDGIYRTPEACHDATIRLLDLPDPPTCIIYPDDLAAIGGINAIKERGLRLPEDISIAGYDGIDLAKMLEPKITTIEQDTEALGRKAAEKLIGMIEHPKSSIVDHIEIPGRLLVGDSVKNINS
ncbi:MAG: LacI family DNA-binding transcriptional regulator [Lachnospiraceae bacterium]|nr:LacI family DNA-binding transcriptional regulator [Lachnospiraceae bacterium]